MIFKEEDDGGRVMVTTAIGVLGATTNSPYFVVDGLDHPVHVVYDVPHLLKSVRNNFIRYNIKIDGCVASWEHVDKFYQLDKASPVRLAPRLTDRHIEVSNVLKMRVCLAAQVLSHSLAAGLRTRVLTNELNAEVLHTAAFVEKMDNLFDLLNSRRKRADKPARCAIAKESTNLKLLASFREWVAKWEFTGARVQSTIKCHQGLQISLQSIYALSCELMNDGFIFVCTSRFNQDCLENVFAAIRSKQGWNENPTPAQFHAAFRSAIILSLIHI